MNFLRSTYFRKTSAAIFIALFVFIHVVKAMHTHEVSSTTINADKNATTVTSNFSCSICDFQLAKDSDTFITSFNIEIPPHFISIQYHYLLPVATSFAIASDNKGPPSLA